MDKKIEELFSAFIQKPKINWSELTDFGFQIAPTILNSSDEDIKNTMDTIYLGLLRKGHAAFDAFESNYDEAAISYIRTAINDKVRTILPSGQAYDFSVKLKSLITAKYDVPSLITKQVAICLAENVDNDIMNLKLQHLSNEIIRYTSERGSKKTTPQQLTEAYNQVYDEFAFHKQLNLLPQFTNMTIKEVNNLSDRNDQSNDTVKSILQGLSNLKDANTDTLDFPHLLEKLTPNPTDNIGILVKKYLKDSTDNVFNSVIKDLTKEIISQDIEKQAILWDKVREEFSMPNFKNTSNEKITLREEIVTTAVQFVTTNEERNALIRGISGMVNLYKKENLSATIINMRNNFTGNYAIPMKKIV